MRSISRAAPSCGGRACPLPISPRLLFRMESSYIGSTDGNLYAFSVNGRAPASRLPGGELGVRPALSSLKPDYSLRASQ